MDSESLKTARVIFLYQKLQNGLKFTTVEAHSMLEDEFGTTSLRTVQRDLRLLSECDTHIYAERIGKQKKWKLENTRIQNISIPDFRKNEILSFHILKAHLKVFKDTAIEDDIKELTRKIETIAPHDIFSSDSLYWDQNAGQFDYTQYDPIIRRIMKYIAEKKWVKVFYHSGGDEEKIKDFTILLRCFFHYAGSLYCVAYVPYHKHHIALSVQNIEKLVEIANFRRKIPTFDFNKWSKSRFGVFYGSIRKVVLRIDKNYNHYFENRIWHQSQKFEYDDIGNMIIEMRVPLGEDFISWIMSWSEAITVLKPTDLIKEINLKLRNSLKNYE